MTAALNRRCRMRPRQACFRPFRNYVRLHCIRLAYCIFRNVNVGDFKAELTGERDLDVMVVSIEVRHGVDPTAAAEQLKMAVRDKFGLTPSVVLMPAGSLAKEFEASVKMPRFADRRG